MKNDVLPSVDNVDEKLVWAAKVERDHVQYSQNPNLGVDFYNVIDAWTRMEFAFKHRIQRPTAARGRKDFKCLYYSVKGRVD